MPSPAPVLAPILTPPRPALVLSGRQTLTGTGASGGGIVVFSNNHTATWTAWNEQYTSASVTASGSAVTVSLISDVEGSTDAVSDRIWVRWNQEYATAASATLGTDVTISNATGSATTVTIDPWPAWNQTYVRDRQITDEQYRAERRRQEEAMRAHEARHRAEQTERQQATDRAALLLRDHLTPEQRAELADKRYFTLRTLRPDGEERIYRIHKGRSHNIERVDAAGQRLQRYCMHPVVHCPDEDTMLTQKLWLQNPELEEELLRRANRS